MERLRAALRAVWNDPQIEEIMAGEMADPYPVIRYGPPNEDFAIDLLSRLGTEVGFDDLDVEVIELEGVKIRLATAATLYRMKKGTVRPIDRADAVASREKFRLEE